MAASLRRTQAFHARNIRQLRGAAGLTQAALAAAAELSESFLQSVELRPRVPSPETLAAIASGLGVSVAQLGKKLPAPPPKRFGALAERIRRAREAAGLLQREPSEAVGVSKACVQTIETARFVPSRETLGRIGAVLGLRAAELEADAVKARLPAVSRALREARAAAGVSRFELAVRAGVTESYVTAIETGRRRPSVDAVLRFAEALGVAPETLRAHPEITTRLRRRVPR